MRQLTIIQLFLILFLTAGCASRPSLIDPTSKVDTTKGILLASVTSDGVWPVMDAWFFYRKQGSTKGVRLDAFGLAGLLMRPNDFADKDSRMGRLIAIPLEPGDYELFTWMLYVTRPGGYEYVSPKVPPPPHRFTIQAGQMTYLGGLHIKTVLGKILGIPVAVGGNPDITDRSAADLAILKRKYPNLTTWPVKSSVPDGNQWKLGQ